MGRNNRQVVCLRLILALAFLLSTHAAPRTSSSHSFGPDLIHRVRELNKLPHHARKLLAVKATVADVDDNVADVDGSNTDASSAESAPAEDGLEADKPESASASEKLEVTMEDVLISDDASSSKDDDQMDDQDSQDGNTQPRESSPAEKVAAEDASSKTDGSAPDDAEQQIVNELIGGDLGYGPEIQAFDDVTEPDDGIAEDADDGAEYAEEDAEEGSEDDTEDFSSGVMSDLGITKDDVDEDDDVEWEEDIDFLVKPDEEAVSEKDERRAGATGEAAGGLAEGEGVGEGGELAEGATGPVAVLEQAEAGGLSIAATDDINKGPEPQVFDDVNEPEANNADRIQTATVADGNTNGPNVEVLEERKEEASSASDNKVGGIDEGLKDIIAFDAKTIRNPISMVLEEDIESANKGTEEILEIEGEGKEEGDEMEGHRRVLWMLENGMETEMEEA